MEDVEGGKGNGAKNLMKEKEGDVKTDKEGERK